MVMILLMLMALMMAMMLIIMIVVMVVMMMVMMVMRVMVVMVLLVMMMLMMMVMMMVLIMVIMMLIRMVVDVDHVEGLVTDAIVTASKETIPSCSKEELQKLWTCQASQELSRRFLAEKDPIIVWWLMVKIFTGGDN